MIKANELRIGNKLFTAIAAVITINRDHLYHMEDQCENFSGIPLTPEILESCGFEYNAEKHTHVVKIFDDESGYRTLFIGSEANFYWWGLQDYTLDSIRGFKIHYLHQLQNLYFALTGKELEIKS